MLLSIALISSLVAPPHRSKSARHADEAPV
jgi:hypothetical protein